MRAPKRKAVRCSNTLTAIKETNIQNNMNAPDFIAPCARCERAATAFCFDLQAGARATEVQRFATLKAQFAKHGHTLRQSGPNDGPGPVSYLAERWGMARYLPTLADAEQFLIQVGGTGHEL